MKIYLSVIALLGWFALIAQFCINMNSGLADGPELLIRFFTFFTVTTNILVAVLATVLLLRPASAWGMFFSRQSTAAAVSVYIVVVGLIYNLILRALWHPEGLQRVVDELLHLVIPVLFLLYWLMFVRKDELRWGNMWGWLVYPLVYIVLVMIRGAFSGFYPYPFLDVLKIGYPQTFLNCLGVTVVFVVLSLLFIAIGKWMAKVQKIKSH